MHAKYIIGHIMLSTSLIGKSIKEKKDDFVGFQLPRKNPVFVQRTQSENLHAELRKFNICILAGTYDIGKTEIAANYVVNGKTIYHAIAWFHAGNITLGAQFQLLATQWCKKPNLTVKEAVKAVYKYLENKVSLIVFDRAYNPDQLKDFVPPSSSKKSPHILITSRWPRWDYRILNIAEFTADEAEKFIRLKLATSKFKINAADIASLSKKLDYSAVALNYATSYILQSGCDINAYIEKCDALEETKSESDQQKDKGIKNLIRTHFKEYDNTYQLIKKLDNYPKIKALLELCSALEKDEIPITLLQQCLSHPKDLQDQLNLLTSLGLAYQHEDCINLQGTLQNVIAMNLTQQGLWQTLLAEYLKNLMTLYSSEKDLVTKYKLMPHLKHVISGYSFSLYSENELYASSCKMLADVYELLDDQEKVKECLEKVISISKKIYPEFDIRMVTPIKELAEFYRKQDDLQRYLILFDHTKLIIDKSKQTESEKNKNAETNKNKNAESDKNKNAKTDRNKPTESIRGLRKN